MPAHDPNPLREARVGLVTMCLVLGVSAVLIVLCNINWSSRRTYRVGFRVNQDATGIEPGTPVTLGGLTWGHVLNVSNGDIASDGSVANAMKNAPAGSTRGTLVEFDLDSRIELHDGAKVARSATILGGNVQLQVVDTGLMRSGPGGLPTKTRGLLGEGAVVVATEANTGFTTLVGPRAAARLLTLPDDFNALMKSWNEEMRPGAAKAFDALKSSGQPVVSSIRADQPEWSSSIDRLGAASSDLGVQLSDEPGPTPSVARDLSQGWKRGKPDLDAVKADFNSLQERLDKQEWPRAQRLWNDANDQWQRMKTLGGQAARAGADSIDALNDVLANSSLMGGQVKRMFDTLPATLLEALLGQPGESGMQRLQRFDATSRLAIATDDLRQAADALEALADASRASDPALSARLRERAAKAVLQFRAAIDALLQQSPQP